jgi:hypothetical protein
VRETENFVNDGYGWACKRCRALEDSHAPTGETALPRFFREGEAEERDTRLAANALARWTDDTRRTLRCPRCGVEEEVGG